LQMAAASMFQGRSSSHQALIEGCACLLMDALAQFRISFPMQRSLQSSHLAFGAFDHLRTPESDGPSESHPAVRCKAPSYAGRPATADIFDSNSYGRGIRMSIPANNLLYCHLNLRRNQQHGHAAFHRSPSCQASKRGRAARAAEQPTPVHMGAPGTDGARSLGAVEPKFPDIVGCVRVAGLSKGGFYASAPRN
jgi:hypothetical protein